MTLALTFLGGFQVAVNEQPAIFATDRARALLAYLAVEADQAHRRESLANLLWTDDLASSARQNLSQTLLRLRQTVGDQTNGNTKYASPFLEITRQSLQLKHSGLETGFVTLDVRQFQRLLATGDNHAHADLSQ